MMLRHSSLFMVLFMATALLMLSTTLTTAQVVWTDAQRRAVIRTNNILKCVHGQSSADWFKYSKCIENFSQTHSTFMAVNNVFQHSGTSYTDRSCYTNRGYGENIAAGYTTSVAALEGFYWNEINNVNWSNPQDASAGVVGHLTAMIWKAAVRQGMAGAWNSAATYKYYWTQNPSSLTSSTSPNMSGAYLTNVTPISTTTNYTKCERDVMNYYNADPSLYFDATDSPSDNTISIYNVKVNGATSGTVNKGTTATITWSATDVGTGTFSVIFYDIGSNTMHVNGRAAGTTATTLSTSIASATRTATVTIPASAKTSDFGMVCVVSGQERACVGGLLIR